MLNALVSRGIGATVAAAAIAALSYGCSTPTKVSDQWRDPSYYAGPVKRVVVIGQDLPPSSRRVVEDKFVAELGKRGVNAVPSYSLFGDQGAGDDEARAKLVSRGFDSALVLDFEGVREQPRYVPGQSYYTGPYGPYYWGGPGYYSYSPGYYVTDQIVTFDNSLVDLRTGKRVWVAATTTVNPSSSEDYAKSISKKVLPQLTKQGLLEED